MADFSRTKELEDAKHDVLDKEAVYTSALAKRTTITTEFTDYQTAQADWEAEIQLRVQEVGTVPGTVTQHIIPRDTHVVGP